MDVPSVEEPDISTQTQSSQGGPATFHGLGVACVGRRCFLPQLGKRGVGGKNMHCLT